MKVKNNNITIVRGETAMLKYLGVRRDGTPYILAPIADTSIQLKDRRDYAVLAFTVKTAAFGEEALAIYCDLENEPMYDGYTDYTPNGFHKFVQQTAVEASVVSDITDVNKVYMLNEQYFTRITNDNCDIVPYKFALNIPLTWQDTERLEPKEYTYDLTLYYGQLTDAEYNKLINPSAPDPSGFPLKEVTVKIPLITAHKFIVEESNNVQTD